MNTGHMYGKRCGVVGVVRLAKRFLSLTILIYFIVHRIYVNIIYNDHYTTHRNQVNEERRFCKSVHLRA